MQVSYNLLKQYVDIDFSPEELASRLSMSGIVAEHTRSVLDGVRGVFIGKITELKPLDKGSFLTVCTIDLKNQILEVVCGAKNMKEGDIVPVATEGGTLPGLGVVKVKRIQGFHSGGMICSASELGLEKSKSPGVLILENHLTLGEEIRNIKGIGNDVIFDFEIFSNRPDLMSIIGLAREISVISGNPLRLPDIQIVETAEKVSDSISVEVIDEDLCPRYAGRIVKGLQVQESPFWLRWNLFLLGIRPINNIVDVTNYVMMETGQPLHAFDLDFIHGQKIIVRRANPGEIFKTLDGIERVLTEENLVIADCDRSIALAGVMGGENSEIKNKTRDVFLESAYFEPINNRRTNRYFAMRTDASNRFEKGIDPFGQVFAVNRAASLITQLTTGQLLSGVIDQYSKKLSKPEPIELNWSKVQRITGTRIGRDKQEEKERIVDILTKLEFKIDFQDEHSLKLTPPSFRGDVERDVDVIEEVARVFGYENIPSTLFTTTVAQEGKNERQKVVDKTRNILVGCGMHQIISYSMVSPKCFDWLRLPSSHYLREAVELTNPLLQEQTIMRTTLIPGLLKAIQWNVNHSVERIKLFEMGRVYFPQNKKNGISLPLEKLMVTGGIAKIGRGNIWEKTENWNIFYLKGILESLFDSLRLLDVDYLPGDLPFFHPQKNGIIKSLGNTIGIFGDLHKDICSFLDIRGDILLFELDFAELFPLLKREITFEPLPKYPYIQRDMAIVVPESVDFDRIKKEIFNIKPDIVKNVEIFDVFRGKQIRLGCKSIAFSIVFQSNDRTLTDMEVDKVIENVTIRLKELFQADLRR